MQVSLNKRHAAKTMLESETETYREHLVPESYVDGWQETVNVLARIFDVPAGLIMRVLPSEIEVLVANRTRGNPYERQEKARLNTGLYCETVMATRSPLHVPNALEDPAGASITPWFRREKPTKEKEHERRTNYANK